jgi:hypothetical protein
MGLDKINLDIKMDFMNLKFWFKILFDFFILSVMVKSYRLNFQLH